MLFVIIKYSILSLLIIYIFHYLYDFFRLNLTVPKIKDLVNKPENAYAEIFNTINKNDIINDTNIHQDNSKINMKNELKKYLSNLNSTLDSAAKQNDDWGKY